MLLKVCDNRSLISGLLWDFVITFNTEPSYFILRSPGSSEREPFPTSKVNVYTLQCLVCLGS